MKRFGILTFQFYRLLLTYNITFSILTIVIANFNVGHLNPGSLLLGKITGFTAAVALNYYSAKNSYFYFRNAGYRISQIIAGVLALDILVCILLIIIYNEATCCH